MRHFEAMVFAASAALLGGCAAMEQAMEKTTRRNEARQLAWTGPGIGPCAFGGVTPLADEHCAMLTWGPEGVLIAVNNKARARLGPGASAQAHVEQVSRILVRHEDLKSERLYSCAPDLAPGEDCHVSLLVTTADGERFVLDNGTVVGAAAAADGVATLAAFELMVDGDYAVGSPPARHVAGAGASAGAAAR
jgi:hypothetical protein